MPFPNCILLRRRQAADAAAVPEYALANQPLVRQARIDEDITDADNRIALAAWLPQMGLTASAQHYFQLPITSFPNLTTGVNEPRQIGVRNTSRPWAWPARRPSTTTT